MSQALVEPASPEPPQKTHRLLPPPGAGTSRTTLAGHLAAFGELPYQGTTGALAALVEAAGLTGRGGAAFPTHRKLRAVAQAPGRAVVVANGAEGEPASAKDRHLLTTAPHLVLDGLQLVAEAVGARRGHVYLPDDPAVLDELARLNAAYEERHGFRFVVFVNRRPKREILDVLQARIGNLTDEELETALGELVAIAEDRWRRR